MRLTRLEPLGRMIGPALVRGLAATWRFRRHGAQHVRSLLDSRRSFIYVLWHSRILPLLYLHRDEGVLLLVSRHRDGALLVDLGDRWGYRSVRGSTRRGGEIGLLGIVRALEGGAVAAITPDGPRGPAERVQPGAVAAAQHANVPIIPVAAEPAAAWWLRTWDRMCIPKPFARVDVTYGSPISVGPGKDGLRRGLDAVAEALHRMTVARP